MQRKSNFPVVNCSIKMPDSKPAAETLLEEEEPLQRRQQLINFGHAQWGFNNWNWAVTKQDLDFVEMSNGKYMAGVVAFVSVTVKTCDIHRENIGYATSLAPFKGAAIHNARKCAVTNALRETLLSFGGTVATELIELIEARKADVADHITDNGQENNQNTANKHAEPKIGNKKDAAPVGVRVPMAPLKSAVTNPPPVAKAHPMPANLPSAATNLPSAATNLPSAATNLHSAATNLPSAATNSNRPPTNAPRHPHAPPPQAAPPAPFVRPNSNEVPLEDLGDEEARAERKRRQKLAQEQFRLQQLLKKIHTNDEQENENGIDNLLMAIPSQDIVIKETGSTVAAKRQSRFDGGASKRRSVSNKLSGVDMK